jgi:hypothetical protein
VSRGLPKGSPFALHVLSRVGPGQDGRAGLIRQLPHRAKRIRQVVSPPGGLCFGDPPQAVEVGGRPVGQHLGQPGVQVEGVGCGGAAVRPAVLSGVDALLNPVPKPVACAVRPGALPGCRYMRM